MLYSVLRKLFVVFFWIGRVKFIGRENFPAEGAVIMAANHVSLWDPVVMAVGVDRAISFMAKEELFEHAFFAGFLGKLHSFPVKRGAPDRKALKMGLEVLGRGDVLGLFPEGTRSKTGELSKPQHGIALLAIKGKAVVVPVACKGTSKIFPWGWFSPVEVIVGHPVSYEQYYDAKVTTSLLDEVSKDIMDKISRLQES